MKSQMNKQKMLRRLHQDPTGHHALKAAADGKTNAGLEERKHMKGALNANRNKPQRLKNSHLVPSKAEGQAIHGKKLHARYTTK